MSKDKNQTITKTILLFREHENFQPGKSRLHKGSVFETNFLWIFFAMVLALGAIWGGGYSLRMTWQYLQSGAETTGVLLGCRVQQSSKSSSVYLQYEYFVNSIRYEAEDEITRYRSCLNFTQGDEETVFYLGSNPEISRLEAFVTGNEWYTSGCFGSMGLIGLGYCYLMMMKNRRERYKHARLQKSGESIVDARVTNVGMVSGKGGYHYAHYQFAAPKGNYLNGELRSNRQYKWPHNIQEGDSLQVLYLDDEAFCVL